MTTALVAYSAVVTVLLVLALVVIYFQHAEQKRIVGNAVSRLTSRRDTR